MNKLCIGITTWNNIDNIDNIVSLYKNDKGYKVYVADDLSNDGLIEKYKEHEIEFMSVSYKVGAPGLSRNMILDAAINDGYEFITFCDGDDYFDLDALLRVEQKLDNTIDFAYANMISDYGDIQHVTTNSNPCMSGIFTKDEYEELNRINIVFMSSGGRIYNLNTIAQNNLSYALDLPGQDTLFNTQIRQFCKKILVDNENNFYFRTIDKDSLSNKVSLKSLMKRYKAINQIIKLKRFDENEMMIRSRARELNQIRDVSVEDKYAGLEIIFDGTLNDSQYNKLYNELKSEMVFLPNLNFRDENPVTEVTPKKQGLSIITVGDDVYKQITENKYVKNLEIEIIPVKKANPKQLNIALGKINYQNVVFFNKNYKVKDTRFDKLLKDLEDSSEDQIIIPIVSGANTIRSGYHNNLFLYENILREKGNIFYGSIFNADNVQKLGFCNLGQGYPVSSEFLIMYMLKYGAKPILYPHYDIENINYNQNSSNDISLVAQTIMNKNELIAAKSQTTLNPDFINTPNVFTYTNGYQLDIVCPQKLSKAQLNYLNYQVSFINRNLFDGVYFTDEFEVILGIVYFGSRKELNLDSFVKINIAYENNSSVNLADIIEINPNNHKYAIEGQKNLEKYLNFELDNKLLDKIIKPKTSICSKAKGLTLICIGSKVSNQVTEMAQVDNVQLITIAGDSLIEEITSVYGDLKYNRTLFVDENTVFYDFDIKKYSNLVNSEKFSCIVNTIKHPSVCVPQLQFNEKLFNFTANIKIFNLCVDTNLLNFEYNGNVDNELDLLQIYLVRNSSVTHYPCVGIGNESNPYPFKIRTSPQMHYLTNTDIRRLELLRNSIVRKLILTNDSDENRVNEWTSKMQLTPMQKFYIDDCLKRADNNLSEGLVIESHDGIVNKFHFKEQSFTGLNNHLKIKVATEMSDET